MSQFKSGIITKYGVTLTPEGKEDLRTLLWEMKVKDTNLRQLTEYRHFPKYSLADGFVAAELIPPMNRATCVTEWKYRVCQNTLPDWYISESERYEQMFREAVKEYVSQNYVIMCGHAWQPVSQGGMATRYLYAGSLGNMEFGIGNNYALSDVRKSLLASRLLTDLRNEFGDRLLPISTDLWSSDWNEDYGSVEGDQIALLTDNLYVTISDKIDKPDIFWLATPASTPKGSGAGIVRCGGHCGYRYRNSCCSLAVRPYIVLKS